MKTIRLLCLLSLVLLPLRGSSADGAIKIGDKSITIPFPEGFVRLDGLNPKTDETMQSALPLSNRSLMILATPADAENAKASKPLALDHFFNIQTLKATEGASFTLADFTQAKVEVKKQSASGSSMADAKATIEDRIKESKFAGKLKLGETKSLGIYDESDRSIDFGMLMEVQAGAAAIKTITMAASLTVVHGKLVFLYTYANFKDQADAAWARQTLKSWRETIAAANPE